MEILSVQFVNILIHRRVVFFFTGFWIFYTKMEILDKIVNFGMLLVTASILHPNFLFLVDMCIQLGEIDREWFPIINLRPQVLLLGSNWRKIGRMLLIFTAPHFYVSSYKNSIFRSCTKSMRVFDLFGHGISILVA